MATISQNITPPAGLATGQVAQASQVIALYNALNAFVIPNTFGVWQQAFVNDNLYTLAIGGTVTQDWAMTTSIPQFKSAMFLLPFSWSAGNAPTLLYRLNGNPVTAAQATTNTATGNGVVFGFLAGHDSDVPRAMVLCQIDDGGATRFVIPNTNLAFADTLSIGVTLGGTAGTFNFKHVRFWLEG